ncbi:protein of unknown function [Taphrina deformans PYCC 5710]|uniref:Uncharacterized protein n=1 Tax=Taphrina deformans (strain PYCC 5710 / ATCC 11124 / CBS 356.35 / IMI 108563 / JCM 9778 / NBRC 8474) TaxID=1097556 RepID=R4XFF7_TAPDE|nr:protein of unknown function [Taphrina deformans PYCC 5710]|eukprot:CCG84611.1 protein of unknown function [Taphrina deformans PYCC 5710]
MLSQIKVKLLLSTLTLLVNAITIPASAEVVATDNVQAPPTRDAEPELLRRAEPAKSSVTVNYIYQCGNEQPRKQSFYVQATWLGEHMRFLSQGGIGAFLKSGSNEPYEGHVGFRSGGCSTPDARTACNQLFLGEFRATYNPKTHVVDVSALRVARSGGTAVLFLAAKTIAKYTTFTPNEDDV